MDLGIKGKVAVIIGGSKGLGRASAEALLREGCKIAICSRSQDNLAEASASFQAIGGEYLAKIADYNDAGERSAFFKNVSHALGDVDILVCSSGGPRMGQAADLELEDYRPALENNLLSMIGCAKAVLPAMRSRRWGRIVFITTNGAVQPASSLTLSNVARAGLHAFAKTLANETAKEGITVNCVMPARIDTDRVQEVVQGWADSAGITYDEQIQKDVKSLPAGRYGKPEEFGSAVCFLCGNAASYITGSALALDGGAIKGLR